MRFVLTYRNLVNFKEQNIATLRCLWYVYTCIRVCVYLYIYVRRGLRCCCLLRRQYQSLDEWNGKIAVPLSFLYGLCMAELQSLKLRFFICQTVFDILDYRYNDFWNHFGLFWTKRKKIRQICSICELFICLYQNFVVPLQRQR